MSRPSQKKLATLCTTPCRVSSPLRCDAIARALTHQGPILRSIRGKTISKNLGSGQVGRILKGLAKEAHLPAGLAQRISGHSLRVGAAQDWTIKGLSLPQLMVMGGWEKPDTVIRYIGKSRIRIEGITL